MMELPKNFASNAALSALGSLLEEEEENDEIILIQGTPDNNAATPKSTELDDLSEQSGCSSKMEVASIYKTNVGGGKALRIKKRDVGVFARTAPYPKYKTTTRKTPKAKGVKTAPSVGESTLYLKLWKL